MTTTYSAMVHNFSVQACACACACDAVRHSMPSMATHLGCVCIQASMWNNTWVQTYTDELEMVTGAQQPLQPPERLVSLHLDATNGEASVKLTPETPSQAAAPIPQSLFSPQPQRPIGPMHLQILRSLRHHVAQTTETAAGLPGLQSNDVECKKVKQLLTACITFSCCSTYYEAACSCLLSNQIDVSNILSVQYIRPHLRGSECPTATAALALCSCWSCWRTELEMLK